MHDVILKITKEWMIIAVINSSNVILLFIVAGDYSPKLLLLVATSLRVIIGFEFFLKWNRLT